MPFGQKVINRKTGLPYYEIIEEVLYKRCTGCSLVLPLTEEYYYKGNNNIHGFDSKCIKCRTHPKKLIEHFNNEGLLICRKCLEYKTTDNFYNDPGLPRRGGKGTECKDCQSKRKTIYRRSKCVIDLDQQLKAILSGCKSRTLGLTKNKKYTSLDFSLNLEDFYELYDRQNGLCALSGIKMTYIIGGGKKSKNISIDRIDSNKGYIKDNVQLVCAHVNMMKSNLTEEELFDFCQAIVVNYEKEINYGN